jgi:hypothetical protein
MITLRPRIVMKKTTQLPLGRMAHERLVHLLYASWSAGRLPRHLVQFSGDLLDGDHEVAHVDRSDVTVPLVEEGGRASNGLRVEVILSETLLTYSQLKVR